MMFVCLKDLRGDIESEIISLIDNVSLSKNKSISISLIKELLK